MGYQKKFCEACRVWEEDPDEMKNINPTVAGVSLMQNLTDKFQDRRCTRWLWRMSPVPGQSQSWVPQKMPLHKWWSPIH